MRMEEVIREVGVDRTGGKVVAAGLGRVRELLPDAPQTGVAVLAGTDLTVPSGRVGEEALRLLDYGLSPADAVRSVTSAAYGYAGIDQGFSVGGPADVVAFDAHPVENPEVLLDPAAVMRAGVVRRGLGRRQR
jgi:imidazolonepropionase-like amidohydrolase